MAMSSAQEAGSLWIVVNSPREWTQLATPFWGNHEVIHTNGSAPIIGFYPVQVNHVGSLDPTVEPRLEQLLRN
jgi:hypothetical protein